MARLRCLTCGGEYDDVLPDGMRYFHTCPPERRVRVRRLDGTIVDLPLEAVLPTDVELGQVFVPRADARDENVVPVPGRAGRPKAEGRGVERLRE